VALLQNLELQVVVLGDVDQPLMEDEVILHAEWFQEFLGVVFAG
jgi:hypothetical protein